MTPTIRTRPTSPLRAMTRRAPWTILLASIVLIASPVAAVEQGDRVEQGEQGDGGSRSPPREQGDRSPILLQRQDTLEQRLARALDVCIGARDYCRADRDWWVDRSVALEEICLRPETPDRTPDWGLILGGTGVGVAVGVIATVIVYEVTK